MRLRKFSEEVLFTKDNIVKIRRLIIDSLKSKSLKNRRKRIRLCAHRDVTDELHEMFIVHNKDIYIRPHKHKKSESLHVIEGKADIIFFNDKGKIVDLIQMGDYSSGKEFYYRISSPLYHTMLIKSDFLVFHETKAGPFEKSNIIFAPWTPDEKNNKAVKEFLRKLVNQIKDYQKTND